VKERREQQAPNNHFVSGVRHGAAFFSSGDLSMTTPADEKIFILSDDIIDRIYSFFAAPGDHNEKTQQACAALQALINVIGMVLVEIECPHCLKIMTNGVQSSFVQMLKDVPDVRAEVHGEPVALH
jgi:hypothetical protein